MVSVIRFRFSLEPRRLSLVGEDFRKMNARPELKEALIIRKLKRWALIARHPSVGKGCPVWRARKNYWSLIRKHRALAERHGLRETDVI